MNNWKECKLGDVATIIGGGTPSTSVKEYWNGNIPWLTPKDLSDHNCRFISNGERYISEQGLNNSSARLLPKNTVLLSSRAPVGYLAISLNDLATNQGFRSLIPNNKTTTEFLYYLLKNNVDYLQSQSTGSTFGELSGSTLASLQFLFPPLPEQQAIAGVLSSLDDKIDLLHRQNKTLEAMAETLFRKWFVEEAEESWPVGKLGDFGDIICGKTPSKKISNYFGGSIPFIKIPDMHNNTFVFETEDSLTKEGADSQINKLLPLKSICVSCIATVGLVSMNAFASQTNQQINSIIPKKNYYRYFLYLLLKTMKDDLLSRASGGTATDNLNTGDFSRIENIKPEDNILISFNDKVEKLFDKIYNNQIQIYSLEKLRDSLLPKLMSGEVKAKIKEK